MNITAKIVTTATTIAAAMQAVMMASLAHAQTSQLTPAQQAQLAQLKDIHLPPPISWWPLAIGWWIVLAMVVLAALLLVSYRLKTRASRRAKHRALSELDALVTDDAVALASELSALLRRVAIFYQGKQKNQHKQNAQDGAIANCYGAAWADFLAHKGLPRDLADYLAVAPYTGGDNSNGDNDNNGDNRVTAPPAPSPEALKNAAARWIGKIGG